MSKLQSRNDALFENKHQSGLNEDTLPAAAWLCKERVQKNKGIEIAAEQYVKEMKIKLRQS